jgi:biofilm PGA synthesis protein PgaD
MTEPIIEMPSLRTRLTRVRDWIMTALWWVFWLYLIREVFFVALDLFAERTEPIRAALMEDIGRTFGFYFQVIAINGLILIGWARYNRFRFRGKDRRSAKSSVTGGEIAETLSMSLFQVEAAQRARRMVVHHDDYGTITRVDVSAQDAITASTALLSRSGTRTRMSPSDENSRPRTRPSQMREALSQARELFGRKRETTGAKVEETPVAPGPNIAPPTQTKFAPTNDDATQVSRPLLPADDDRTTISRPLPADQDATIVSRPRRPRNEEEDRTMISRPMPKPDGGDAPPRS